MAAKCPEKPNTQSSDSGVATGTGDNVTPGTGKQPLGATRKMGSIPTPVKGTRPKQQENQSHKQDPITSSQESYEIVPEPTSKTQDQKKTKKKKRRKQILHHHLLRHRPHPQYHQVHLQGPDHLHQRDKPSPVTPIDQRTRPLTRCFPNPWPNTHQEYLNRIV